MAQMLVADFSGAWIRSKVASRTAQHLAEDGLGFRV